MQDVAVIRSEEARREFAELLQRHRGIVFKVAAAYAWRPDDRTDLTQEIAAQLWRAFPGYDDTRPFSTWMYRIALNVAISHLRREGRRQRQTVALDERVHEVVDEAANRFEGDAQLRVLERVIAALDPLNRALLLLYLDDRSSREIAEILGLGVSNVTTKLSRLRQRIRGEFG
jgi:RNA polymerase sigma factor (sigma-70 family)